MRIMRVLTLLDLNPNGLRARDLLKRLNDDGFNCVRETVYKDLRALEEAHLPVVNEGRGEDAVWKLATHVKVTRHISFEFNELMALFVARESLGFLDHSPMKDAIESLFQKNEKALGPAVHRGIQEVSSTLSVHPGASWASKTTSAVMDTLIAACNEGHVVQIEYKAVSGERASQVATRRLGPKHLTFRNAGAYLVAEDLADGAIKQYALPRIFAATLLDEEYEPGHFDADEFFKSSFGSLNSGEPSEIELFIREPMATFVEERRLHASQSSVRKEGGVSFKMNVKINDELVRWVLSLGSSVVVLAPTSLREQCIQTAELFVRHQSKTKAS